MAKNKKTKHTTLAELLKYPGTSTKSDAGWKVEITIILIDKSTPIKYKVGVNRF